MKNTKLIGAIVLLMSFLIWFVFILNTKSDQYIYGNSYRQNKIVNTIRLHKYGITGRNINVGILGAGFYTKHSVFKQTKIIKEFDFAENKNTTLNYNHPKGLDHGTNVFSVIGGYQINEIIGIAFGANYILAKTDISTDRWKVEEINAAKGARWLFENGAKIITTSLSFNKFDNAKYYTPEQMNGKTALITKTADSLFNKGVVFFSSAGNNYEEAWHIIEPPGDGFDVIAVGSIDKNLKHSFFSSCGPTTDGRIKPDIVAPGEGVWVANYLPKLKPNFSWSHGTSLAAPIAAGIAALVLSAHPDLSQIQVKESIIKTSSFADNPDNLYGYGIPDAEKAVTYYGPAFSNIPEAIDEGEKIEIKTFVISSYGLRLNEVFLHILTNKNDREKKFKMKLIDEDLFSVKLKFDINKNNLKFYFTAKDKREYKTKFPSGIVGDYFTAEKQIKQIKIIPSKMMKDNF